MDETRRRAERIERIALEDLHAAAPPTLRDALGLRVETVGEATVSIAAGVPSILPNRTLGLGVEAPALREEVAEVRALYAAAGVGRYFVHLQPEAEPPELPDWLAAEGLRPARAWVKFLRGRDPAPDLPAEPRVERVAPDRAEAFARIAADAFGLGEALVPAVAGLVERPGWRLYLAYVDGEPAGVGGLLVQGDTAWFDWGATRPEFRRRGVQRAVLARRVAEALDLGCRLLVTATGEAVPGDPQHSFHNIERAGFRAAYRRENYAPAG